METSKCPRGSGLQPRPATSGSRLHPFSIDSDAFRADTVRSPNLLARNPQVDPAQRFIYTRGDRLSKFTSMSDVTHILSAIEHGDPSAAEQLLPLVYAELRQLAAQKLSHERPGQTLQATALVHEAYLRLVDVEEAQRWNSRRHFFAAAAEAMRRILVEQARRKHRHKHGGDRQRVPLHEAQPAQRDDAAELLAIHEALDKLASEDAEAAQLVQLRYFAGLSVEEAAETMGLPRSSAYVHWSYAKASLRVLLGLDLDELSS
jgi:RNA polymerase sigma factor (TIGR02999 family)